MEFNKYATNEAYKILTGSETFKRLFDRGREIFTTGLDIRDKDVRHFVLRDVTVDLIKGLDQGKFSAASQDDMATLEMMVVLALEEMFNGRM